MAKIISAMQLLPTNEAPTVTEAAQQHLQLARIPKARKSRRNIDDPNTSHHICWPSSFAQAVQQIADAQQGASPGFGNVSILIRATLMQVYGAQIRPMTEQS